MFIHLRKIAIFCRYEVKLNKTLKKIIFTEALLRMVAPGAGFCGGTLFCTKNRQRPKKKEKVFVAKREEYRSKSM